MRGILTPEKDEEEDCDDIDGVPSKLKVKLKISDDSLDNFTFSG